ncbi:MAG: glucosamine-6-phosphate deaminase [Ruminococcaceae bacterium]|nr:glucosamine-6-phosphate deaminase [Oscillospiraceae bacterium]
MKLSISENSKELGRAAAADVAARLREAIALRGEARIVLSTGASQFDMFEALVEEDVDWSKVDMFHLDEYIALPITHKASFRKYLQERFVDRVSLRSVNYVDTEGDINNAIAAISEKLTEKPVDIGLIGIGENGHIAFNDPPADFGTEACYIVVDLDDNCKRQQVREGWFPTPDDVPKQAVSMTVHRIMMCRSVISVVPHEVKAKAVAATLSTPVCPEVPATMLKMHPDWSLYLDKNSASLIK